MALVFINNGGERFTPTNSGALATWIWEVCNVLQKRGMNPTVITRSDAAAPYEWKNILFVPPAQNPKSRFITRLYAVERRLTGHRHMYQRIWMKRVGDAIANANLQEAQFVLQNDPELAVYLRRRFPKAFLINNFQNQQESGPRFRAAYARSVNHTTACSDFTARWLETYYGYQAGEVRTVYNAVNLEAYQPLAEPLPGKPIINFLGRTIVEKAPDTYLKAALLLARRTKNFELQIIGSNFWNDFYLDDFQKELQKLVEEVENAGIVVHQRGHIDRWRLPEITRNAHIHVVPSRWDEPFGLTTVEGMASGLAIVASNTGGTPEVVGDAGFLFERDNVEQLAEILFCLVTDADLLREAKAKARKQAERFTWEANWNQMAPLLGM